MLRRPILLSLLAATVFLPLGAGLAVGGPVGDLDARSRKELVDTARSYLDPSVEFVWSPRKAFKDELDKLAEKGLNAYKDLRVLKDIVYNGRHFKERFDDKGWRKLHDITDFKKNRGVYYNLKAEQYRFTYTEPDAYPSQRDLDKKVPRDDPFPLLLVFHEERDTVTKKGEAEDYPGEAVLDRRYAKDAFPELYKGWFLLAPVAPRASFLLEGGDLQHKFSTQILSEFWTRYHVDFDRFVVDGGPEALAMVATFPHVFAGVVFRGGAIEKDLVQNYASVPVYVVGNPDLKKELDAAGHPDVTAGDEKGLMPWLVERRRKVPRSFHWNVVRADHLFPNWIAISRADFQAPQRTLDVQAIDTEAQPNTLKIDGVGIEEITLYLNDDVVDLDRDVNLVVNGEARPLGKLERDFSQLFEKDPPIRQSMYFGWLYPAVVSPIALPAPAATGAGESPSPPEEDVVGTPADEEKAKKLWDKAAESEEGGDLEKARQLYQLVIDVGRTSLRGQALQKLKDLKQ